MPGYTTNLLVYRAEFPAPCITIQTGSAAPAHPLPRRYLFIFSGKTFFECKHKMPFSPPNSLKRGKDERSITSSFYFKKISTREPRYAL
jgi:hypothetical protein